MSLGRSWSEKMEWGKKRWYIHLLYHSQMIHVWNIYLHLGHFRGNVGKYSIHGASGIYSMDPKMEVPTILIRPICFRARDFRGFQAPKYGPNIYIYIHIYIWYSTSILGSWNAHWFIDDLHSTHEDFLHQTVSLQEGNWQKRRFSTVLDHEQRGFN